MMIRVPSIPTSPTSPDSNMLFRNSSRSPTSENVEETLLRGRALWDSIYEPHADKLHDKLRSYHPDLICECFGGPTFDRVLIWVIENLISECSVHHAMLRHFVVPLACHGHPARQS
jgi:hypothetical protein